MDLTVVTFAVMIKNVYVGYTQGHFKKDITIIEVVLHMVYIDAELLYQTICGKLKRI